VSAAVTVEMAGRLIWSVMVGRDWICCTYFAALKAASGLQVGSTARSWGLVLAKVVAVGTSHEKPQPAEVVQSDRLEDLLVCSLQAHLDDHDWEAEVLARHGAHEGRDIQQVDDPPYGGRPHVYLHLDEGTVVVGHDLGDYRDRTVGAQVDQDLPD